MWLVSIKRAFQGLSVAIETMGIVEELVEIWPNEVCDRGVLLSSLWDEVLSSFWQSLAMRRHYSPWFLQLLCSIEWVCQVGKIRWWGWWLRQGSNFEVIIQSFLLPPDQLHYHYLYHYSNGWACLCLHSSDTSIATLRISLKISCSI